MYDICDTISSNKEYAVKNLDLIEDIRPVSEFRARAAEYIDRVVKNRRPLVLTQHGRSAVVILDVGQYQSLIDRLELLEDIGASEADLAEGRTVTHAKAKRELLARLGR